MQITAKIKQSTPRISQCDIFKNINIIESYNKDGKIITLQKLAIPLVICLNQDCDLNSDYQNHLNNKKSSCQLLHLIVAPVFNFDSFTRGDHWGKIFETSDSITSKKKDQYEKNEVYRYHYLHFDDTKEKIKLPNLIIDFKHFFTINRDYLYENIKDHRVCSLSEIYREKICQRFAFFQSRIGLPD